MAECTIGEYPSGAPNGMQLVSGSNCSAVQVLNVGGASAPSQAFGDGTRSVRVWSDTKMAFRFGKSGGGPPVANGSTDQGFTAGATEYFNVNPGEFIAVIAI